MGETMIKQLFFALIVATLSLSASDKITIDGHQAGKFTMDIKAAKQYAKDNKKAVLLNFTGSDWCGWCKLMEKNVFEKEAWAAYAKDKLALVSLDFPQDKTLVPEKYVPRNVELAKEYGVRSYPTYILLDAQGKVIGKLTAGQEKTPESFQQEVEVLLALTDERQLGAAAKLGPVYEKLFIEMTQLKEKKDSASTKEALQIDQQIAALRQKMELSRRLQKVASDKKVKFKEAQQELAKRQKTMRDFMNSNPARNEENLKKYAELSKALDAAEDKAADF